MELTSRQTIEYLCKKYRFRPQRESGQNFLVSEKSLQAIVAAAELEKDDTVLEIGGGFGTLTNELVRCAGQVITVELDRRLAGVLRKLAIASPNLTVVEGDIIKQWSVISSQLPDGGYKLVANLPYNITSLVLRNFLENQPRPSEMVLLVQKEVAERVTAAPGRMSVLSVAVQFFGVPEVITIVPREHFWPEPEVDSAVLRIRGIGQDSHGYEKLLGGISQKDFFSAVKIGFSARRKQLHNNLAAGFRIEDDMVCSMLDSIGIDPAVRAQDLSIFDWVKIAQKM